MPVFDKTVNDILKEKVAQLEDYFQANVVFYYGEIHHA